MSTTRFLLGGRLAIQKDIELKRVEPGDISKKRVPQQSNTSRSVKEVKRKKRTLQELYEDPNNPGSLGGVKRFAQVNRIPRKTAQEALESSLAYTLHKPRRRKFPTAPVLVFGIDEQWAADLVEVQNLQKFNKGIRYLLTVVDVFSKYAWVRALINKTGAEVEKAFRSIFKEGRKPLRLQTDDGKEFYNKTVQTFLKKEKVHHFSTQGDTKASVAERFNRTLKERLYRFFTAHNTLDFRQSLPAVVKGYNASPHLSIGIAPNQVTVSNSSKVWNKLYGGRWKRPQEVKLKVGDRVRLNKKFRTFKKSYLPGWTEEVFIVDRVKQGPVPTFRITEWDGTEVRGTFYTQDLQKVTVTDDDIFRVEKVLRRKGTKLLVRWKGWPNKYDSWIDKKDIQP